MSGLVQPMNPHSIVVTGKEPECIDQLIEYIKVQHFVRELNEQLLEPPWQPFEIKLGRRLSRLFKSKSTAEQQDKVLGYFRKEGWSICHVGPSDDYHYWQVKPAVYNEAPEPTEQLDI